MNYFLYCLTLTNLFFNICVCFFFHFTCFCFEHLFFLFYRFYSHRWCTEGTSFSSVGPLCFPLFTHFILEAKLFISLHLLSACSWLSAAPFWFWSLNVESSARETGSPSCTFACRSHHVLGVIGCCGELWEVMWLWELCQTFCTHPPLSKEASRASVDKTVQVFIWPSYHVQLPLDFFLLPFHSIHTFL